MITSLCVVQVIALIANLALIFVAFSRGNIEYRKTFLCYLSFSLLWSLSIFLPTMGLPNSQAAFFSKAIAALAIGTAASYSYFMAVYTGKTRNARLTALSGSALVILFLTLTWLGYIPRGLTLHNSGVLQNEFGFWYYLMTCGIFLFIGNAAYLLWGKYTGTTNPEERNRFAYAFLGLSFVIIFAVILQLASIKTYAFDHIGQILNGIALTYLLISENPADIKQTVKSGIIIMGLGFLIFDCFVILLNTLNPLFITYLTSEQYLAMVIAFSFSLALAFNPMRKFLEEHTDRFLYGKRYDYRQMVLSFTREVNKFTEMPALAENILKPIAKTLNSSQVSLLFETDGYYQTYYAERQNPGEPVVSISFREDGPIIQWLKREDTPLYRETIASLPEFAALWKEERDFLEAAHIEMLYPIKTKQKLVAILGLSRKQPRGNYSQNDINLIKTMASGAAVVIENAQLYGELKDRANTDELTGLFNHRYFHEILEQEINRASRFGSVFSLIFMDIDGFKKYNDIYGHLSGDEVIRQTGKLIKRVIRKVDMAFRYGGDEFSILLPETPLQGAKKLCEILRLEMETSTSTEGMPFTCSIGVGSWPSDGITREEIIQSVDTALYYAKQNGKNRVYSASEVNVAEVLEVEKRSRNEDNKSNLEAIYALAATVDAKDSYTYGHSKKVSRYAVYVAEAMGYAPQDIERIRTAGLLHDIGKIGIADNILNKPGYLTPEDFEPIRAHPDKGVAILKNVDSLKDCLPAVRYHHEHYDGTGYPTGLKGKDIPLDARILAVADSYDAMTSQRPYRQIKASQEQAIEELQRCAGTQFDPEVVHVFINLMKNSVHQPKSPVEMVGALINSDTQPEKYVKGESGL